MTTVGYGDITPTNEYEAGLLIIGMMIATALFSYTYNSIGNIIEEISKDEIEYKK